MENILSEQPIQSLTKGSNFKLTLEKPELDLTTEMIAR